MKAAIIAPRDAAPASASSVPCHSSAARNGRAQRITRSGDGYFALLALLALLAPFAAQAVDFEKDIRPVLRERCVECHGAEKQKAGLRLDARSLALKGGDDGPVIVAGKSAESAIFQRITSTDKDERMPSKGDPLTATQIAAFREWLDAGAAWPETAADIAAARDKRLDHWAWQPVASKQLPVASVQSPAEHLSLLSQQVDTIVTAKLTERGIKPLPEADARTLIRRLYFDLTGLPPTFEEVAAFEKACDRTDHSDQVRSLVDKLLASPAYGERWARHWLDIAHYADTHGFERDQRRDNAWRYRDWVIRALNDDMPYDEFLRLQVAGDALHADRSDAIIATGFLAAGPWDFVGQVETPSPVLKRAARADDLDDMVTQVMTAACGVTINCARCHDHKLDPISQREYYALTAVFAGVKRAERDAAPRGMKADAGERPRLSAELSAVNKQLVQIGQRGLDLADIVGGGDGTGTGKMGAGIGLQTGQQQIEGIAGQRPKPNVPTPVAGDFIDCVLLPNGDGADEIAVSTTGVKVRGVPQTSGETWDAIRNGAIIPQGTTKIGATDYAADGHSLLGLHANSAITFDLTPFRAALKTGALRFRAAVGYGGRPAAGMGADVRIFVDGAGVFLSENVGPKSAPVPVDIALPEGARFLTLMSTEGRDGNIGFDQIFYGDPRITAAVQPALTVLEKAESGRLMARKDELEKKLKPLPAPAKSLVFGIKAEPPPIVKLQHRGSPEDLREEVAPGTLACVVSLKPAFGGGKLTDAERRIALANWITDPANPLTARVIVNRLWHHHFGTGLVDTPSDFGLGGGRPSHPELLDFLAAELIAQKWSLKAMHRIICNSAAYRRATAVTSGLSREGNNAATAKDAANRLLWRGPARRLDAESVRDAILAVSGKLNREMHGPGWRDFDYKEEYAPVYSYKTPDSPALWRRSIYRFIVRTTPHQLLTTLDCANPSNLTPARNVTTTALQSLALLNNDFILRQSAHFAERVKANAATPEAQASLAFAFAFSRQPDTGEKTAAVALIQKRGLTELCRMLFNANEFVFVD